MRDRMRDRMRRHAAVFALGAALALAGCGALNPYPTAPLAASPGAAPGPRVAICYNTLTTTLAEVAAQAQQECTTTLGGSRATPADTDWYLQTCPLLLPARASFTCIAKK